MDKFNTDLSTPLVEQLIVLHQVNMDEFANEYQAKGQEPKTAQAKRSDIEFAKANNVLLKLQPRCHSTMQCHISAMLAPWEIAKHLSLPPVKLHCSMLAEDAIKAAVKDYEAKRAKLSPTEQAVALEKAADA
nr:iron-sulfur cluster assembly protein 1-like [Ipomoea batatas]